MKLLAVDEVRHNKYDGKVINSEWGIKKISPYHQAKAIQAPLLLIYGDKDTVVDPEHSIKMHKRLLRRKKQSELVLLPK